MGRWRDKKGGGGEMWGKERERDGMGKGGEGGGVSDRKREAEEGQMEE